MSSIRFTKAIVKTPGHSIINGITTSNLGKPDYKKVLLQHAKYVETLENCGLEVTIMPAEEEYPDSTFVEDCAVLTEQCAVIGNFGVRSRRGEETSVDEVLKDYYTNIVRIEEPGILEGGDVLRVNDHFYIRATNRTNISGANQLIKILEEFGYTGSIVLVEKTLHLKSGISYLGEKKMIVSGEPVSNPAFSGFDKIVVDDDESYAANSIRVNDYVIIPGGFEKTKNAIMKSGYKIKEVDVSEFRKIDGGVSCLSLRF
ncbi:MAG: N(G),N(G)-dimethylarginine dimethylaminohydrolase [candidate division WOR-3 bacterium]|nr:MAG: N(G),N(G)-dimethylarginine dimethylaminohydrolase [candidate division WOR-3 bacterium]